MMTLAVLRKRFGITARRSLSDDRGDAAVMTAIFVVLLLTLLPMVSYIAAVGQQPTVSFDQKYQGALGAAEAGVSAFASELNTDLLPSSPATCTGTIIATLSVCYVSGSSTSHWATVTASSTSNMSAQYEYEAYSNTATTSDPYLGSYTVISTGKVSGAFGSVMRTVQETVSQQTAGGLFTNYFLFANNNAGNYIPKSSSTLYGTMLINLGGYPTKNGQCKVDKGALVSSNQLDVGNPNSTSNCSVGQGGSLNLPPSLSSPYTQIPTEASSGGCTYYGPTYIDFLPTGGYSVYSPETSTVTTNGTNDGGCYQTGATSPVDINTSSSNIVNTNGVIYVEQCTTATSCTASSSPQDLPSSTSMLYQGPGAAGSAVVEGVVSGKYTLAADNNIYIVGPLCYNSDLVSGVCSVSSSTASSTSTDVLGLVATDSVFLGDYFVPNSNKKMSMDINDNTSISSSNSLYNQAESFAYDVSSLPNGNGNQNPPLHAAIMALTGTFAYEYQNNGSDYAIEFAGSVAVNSPCIGGTSTTTSPYADYFVATNNGDMCPSDGYLMEGNNGNTVQFYYDQNLANTTPPFFPQSVNSSGSQSSGTNFAEILNSMQPLGTS